MKLNLRLEKNIHIPTHKQEERQGKGENLLVFRGIGKTCLVSGDEDLLELGVKLDLNVRVGGLHHLAHETLVLPLDHLP